MGHPKLRIKMHSSTVVVSNLVVPVYNGYWYFYVCKLAYLFQIIDQICCRYFERIYFFHRVIMKITLFLKDVAQHTLNRTCMFFLFFLLVNKKGVNSLLGSCNIFFYFLLFLRNVAQTFLGFFTSGWT